MKFKTGQTVRITHDTSILHAGDTGTITEIRPGALQGHTDLKIDFPVGVTTLDYEAWKDSLEVVK